MPLPGRAASPFISLDSIARTPRFEQPAVMPSFIVADPDAGRRLDQYLCDHLSHLSRSRIQQLIGSGHITAESAPVKASHQLRAGDVIDVTEPPPVALEAAPQALPLSILYEDDHLVVIDKPPGMVVHPGAGHLDGTVVNALLHHCRALSGIGGVERPGIVHRLDKDTSGCLVVAKTESAHRSLSEQFAEREVRKIYLAIATGHPRFPHQRVENLIGRHRVHRQKMEVLTDGRGKHAVTEFFVEKQLGGDSLVRCVLHTGRTHQIRVHLKHLGHPLAGDRLYGHAGAWPRQMLHAWKLGFQHPVNGGALDFTSPVPADFRQAGVDLP